MYTKRACGATEPVSYPRERDEQNACVRKYAPRIRYEGRLPWNFAPLAELGKRLTLNQKIPGSIPGGCTIEAVVKWLNTAEESESATMDEPAITVLVRQG